MAVELQQVGKGRLVGLGHSFELNRPGGGTGPRARKLHGELDLVVPGDAVQADGGEGGVEDACRVRCAVVHRNHPKPAPLAETQRSRVVVGRHQPNATASSPSGNLLQAPRQGRADANRLPEGIEGHDLDPICDWTVGQKPRRPTVHIGDERRKLIRLVDQAATHDLRRTPPFDQDLLDPGPVVGSGRAHVDPGWRYHGLRRRSRV